MAIRLIDRYPSRAADASVSYPHGAFRNRSSQTADDGTPLEEDWGNDLAAFLQGLVEAGSITPSGSPDTVLSSDYLDGLVQVSNGVQEVDVDGASEVDLDESQGRVANLRLTGALTGDLDLVVPNAERQYGILNETTGGFVVTVRTNNGTGVDLPQSEGGIAWLRCDGTDVVRATGAGPQEIPANADLPWVTPYMYGAVGDGATDDTQAFQDAIASGASTLYIPAGRFVLKEKLSFGGGPKAIIGQGPFKSWLAWEGSGVTDRGIEVVHQNSWDMTTVKGLTLETDAEGTVQETALRIDHSTPRANTFPQRADPVAVVEDVNIVGVAQEDDGFLSSGWYRGVWSTEAPIVALNRVNFTGDRNTGSFDTINSDTAFIIEGGQGVTDQTVTACQAYNAQTCLLVRGDVEGVRVTDCTFISSNVGVSLTENAGPYLSIQGTHINAQDTAVDLAADVSQAMINSNLFYVFGENERIGIDAPGMNQSVISNNMFVDVGSGSGSIGIRCRDDTRRSTIKGNRFQSVDTGVELQSSTGDDVICKDNYIVGTGDLYVNNSDRSFTYPAFVTVSYDVTNDPSLTVSAGVPDLQAGEVVDFYRSLGGNSAWWLEGTFRSRVRVPISGYYRVSYQVRWDSVGGGLTDPGFRWSRVILNGVRETSAELDYRFPHAAEGVPAGTENSVFQGGSSGPVWLERDDYLEIHVLQDMPNNSAQDVLGAALTLERLD